MKQNYLSKFTILFFVFFFGTVLKSQKCDNFLSDAIDKGKYMVAPEKFNFFTVWLRNAFKDVCYAPVSPLSNRFSDIRFLKQKDFKIGSTGIGIHINPKISDRNQAISFVQRSFYELDQNDLTDPKEYKVFDFEKKLQIALMFYNYIEADALTGYISYISTDPGKVEALIRDIEKKYKVKLDIHSEEDREIADSILEQIINQTSMEEYQFLYDYFIKAETWQKEEENYFYFVRKAIFGDYFGRGKVLPDPRDIDEVIAMKNNFQIKNNGIDISFPPNILSPVDKTQNIRFSPKVVDYHYVETTKEKYIFLQFSQFANEKNTLFRIATQVSEPQETSRIEKIILKIYKDRIDVFLVTYEYNPNLIYSKPTTL